MLLALRKTISFYSFGLETALEIQANRYYAQVFRLLQNEPKFVFGFPMHPGARPRTFVLSQTCRREVVFGHHPLLTSLSARRVLSPPETDRLLLRDQGFGTVCQMTLQLLHLCRCFDEN